MIVIPHAQQHIQTTIQCYFPEIKRPRFQIFPLFLLFPWKVPTRLGIPLGWIQKSSPHFLLETQLFCSQHGLEMCIEKGSFHFHAKAYSSKWRRLFSSKNASQKSTQCLNFRSKQFLSIQSLPGVQRRKPFQTQLGAGMESNKSYCLQIQPRAQHLMSCSHQAGCVCGTGREETWPLGWAKVGRALQGCSALTCSCCGPGRKAFRKDFSLRCSKGANLSYNTVILLVSIEFRAAAECCECLSPNMWGDFLELLWAMASLLLGQEVLPWSIWPPAICTEGDGQFMMPRTPFQMSIYQFLCEVLLIFNPSDS